MTIASKVARLPTSVRRWLDRRLYKNGFGEYTMIATELAQRGFLISKSSLHRYGSKLRDRVQTEEAKALTRSK